MQKLFPQYDKSSLLVILTAQPPEVIFWVAFIFIHAGMK
jgi:hypothetical protein